VQGNEPTAIACSLQAALTSLQAALTLLIQHPCIPELWVLVEVVPDQAVPGPGPGRLRSGPGMPGPSGSWLSSDSGPAAALKPCLRLSSVDWHRQRTRRVCSTTVFAVLFGAPSGQACDNRDSRLQVPPAGRVGPTRRPVHMVATSGETASVSST
jgi:hypothetical protein